MGSLTVLVRLSAVSRYAQLPAPPYRGAAQQQAESAYEEYGGQRAHFAGAVFSNPVEKLIAYLRDPDPERWAHRALNSRGPCLPRHLLGPPATRPFAAPAAAGCTPTPFCAGTATR